MTAYMIKDEQTRCKKKNYVNSARKCLTMIKKITALRKMVKN